MTQTRDLIKKMAEFFRGEEFYEKGEDARLELSPDDVRCMNEVIKACGNAISREDALLALTGEWTELTDEIIHRFIKRIQALPPVIPQPKIGCEGCIYEKTGNNSTYPCSHCGRCYTDKYKAERSDKK